MNPLHGLACSVDIRKEEPGQGVALLMIAFFVFFGLGVWLAS